MEEMAKQKEKQVEGKKEESGVQRGHREKWSQWTCGQHLLGQSKLLS